MKKQAIKGIKKRQKKQEQAELQQENKRLSEENYRLRMENDYLKKIKRLNSEAGKNPNKRCRGCHYRIKAGVSSGSFT